MRPGTRSHERETQKGKEFTMRGETVPPEDKKAGANSKRERRFEPQGESERKSVVRTFKGVRQIPMGGSWGRLLAGR